MVLDPLAGGLSASSAGRDERDLRRLGLGGRFLGSPVGLAFDRPIVVFGDTFSRAIIGGQAVSGYAVNIDLKNRRLRLEQ